MKQENQERREAEAALQKSESRLKHQAAELASAMDKLQRNLEIIQAEKMSGLAKMVGGIAHEINNPMNFICANLSHVNEYSQNLIEMIALYQNHYPQPHPEIAASVEELELDFLLEDLPQILQSMENGTERIKKIVESLRAFSRLDEAEMKPADIHQGIESTLMILSPRLEARSDRPQIEVIKDYGQLPKVYCAPGQLNQVFMHLLVNAIDAVEEYLSHTKLPETLAPDIQPNQSGQIRISTQVEDEQWVKISIANSGASIPAKIKEKIFDPFFTTKPVGQGNGLGLAISYQIIVEKHQGQICCISEPGQGAEFMVKIPLKPPSKSN